MSSLREMKYNIDFYYKIRSIIHTNNIFGAARSIYLNKTCWNGLYRVNKEGNFNVPFGYYNKPTIYDENHLRAVSKVLQRITISCKDFGIALKKTNSGDLIYLDPPYVTAHGNNGFIKYNSRLFSMKDQERLYSIVCWLDTKKCKIIMSNASDEFIIKMYKKFNINTVERMSLIAGQNSNRRLVQELIITNFDI
jgi:DNA adenine methylase